MTWTRAPPRAPCSAASRRLRSTRVRKGTAAARARAGSAPRPPCSRHATPPSCPACAQNSTEASAWPASVRWWAITSGAQLDRPLLQGRGDPGMDQLPRAAQQAGVGRVLHQRVLEDVGRVGRHAAAEDQLGRRELVPGQSSSAASSSRRHGGEQVARELAADRRRGLRHLLDRCQAVEPRHQRSRAAWPGSPAAAAGRPAATGRPRPRAGRSPAPPW